MDALIIFIAVVVGFALFDLLAVTLGADSRDDFAEEPRVALSA